ncbi:MAG TPA: aldo/keto reductase [Methanoregula sp.]|nr:aldo/keto reductase [Methanoregula sp.]
MLYRKFPKVPIDLSILGFGCMRLPVQKNQQIDEQNAREMIRYAIDCGVNYIDTAYPYHDGQSEPFVGRALGEGGYREKVFLATKLPCWLITKREDMDRYLEEQLERLETDQIDFYLVHGLNQLTWETTARLCVLEFLDDAVADGRIRYPAFSFHDTLPLFREIVDAYDWTFAQIQYNFMDEQYQAGTEGLKYAAERGLGIVVMEPLRGGLLAKGAPGIADIIRNTPARRTMAELGLRWVWNHPEVTFVLSGMSTMEQVVQNLAYADQGKPGSLSRNDLALIGKVRNAFNSRIKIPCTGCGYCMPCENGVDIPKCFEFYNQAHIYDAKDQAGGNYSWALNGTMSGIPGYASCCLACGECETKCPQGLPIQKYLKEVAEYFGK